MIPHGSLTAAANASLQQWSVLVGFASVSFHVHHLPALKNIEVLRALIWQLLFFFKKKGQANDGKKRHLV